MNPLRLFVFAMIVAALSPLHAQISATSSASQGINYQSVARDPAGQILANQPVHLRISIRDSSAAGAILYQEHHQVTTNAFGTFSIVVGGGSIILGNFGTIPWGSADKYLQTEMDFAGGNNFRLLGASKLQSVAYALYAGTSAAMVQSVKYDTTGILNIQTAGSSLASGKPAWIAGGSSGLTSSNGWLGTLDNTDVVIKQGNVEAVRYVKGGALMASGGSAGTTPASGPGKRMEWIPAKAAFRAGTVTGSQWDDAYIGSGSMAIGTDVIASGVRSTAIGTNAQALDSNVTVIGTGLLGKGTGAVVIGAYNDTTLAPSDTTAGDKPIFQVGSGTSDQSRSNALTVQRDGDVYATQLILSRGLNLTPTYISVLTPTTLSTNEYSYARLGALGLPALNVVTLGNGNHAGQLLALEGQSLLGAVTGAGIRILDSGNARLNGNMDILSSDFLTLVWDGHDWLEISRSINH